MSNETCAWLKRSVLTMGNKTASAVELSIQALINNDITLAGQVREIEKIVDEMYYVIDECCLTALSEENQNRAQSNFVVSSLKIAMELERICDYANQIAKLVQKKFSKQDVEVLKRMNVDAAEMCAHSLAMLRNALKAYEQRDAILANELRAEDTCVNKGNKYLFREMICLMSVNRWVQEAIMDFHIAIRYVERIGDRATNIGELVYYIVHGEPINKKTIREDLWI